MIVDGLGNKTFEITSFLMAGQSNMAGRGNLDEVEPIKNNDLYMLRMGRWQKHSEPVNPDRPVTKGEFHSGVGLASSFADDYVKHFGRKAGLIPCADGGTSLSQWMPGEILFDHAVFMTKLAMRTSDFGGIIWHQGESDCNAECIGLYKERFITMMSEMRRQLGAEELPLIIGELSLDVDGKRWKHVEYAAQMNSIFHEIAKEIPNCAVASADGITIKKSDGLHFDSVGSREFGHRYFEKYLEVLKR